MAAEGDNHFMRYVYRGEEGEIIPREATHITVAESCTFVRAWAFYEHPNIVEIICHKGVKKIESWAFQSCPNLRRVIMPGVKIVEQQAFDDCRALTDVECGKLEIIGEDAFSDCESLRNINLPSVRIVAYYAFNGCKALTDAKFSSKLERIDEWAFCDCFSLQRITIPLKDGIISADNIFQLCEKLMHTDLVEEAELHATTAALHLEKWRNDMNREIDSINQILPNARAAGDYDEDADEWVDPGEKAEAIRMWIRSVRQKIVQYKAEHQSLLNEAATTLQFALPNDVVEIVLPFLVLPSYTFEGEDQEDGDSDGE